MENRLTYRYYLNNLSSFNNSLYNNVVIPHIKKGFKKSTDLKIESTEYIFNL